MKPIAFTAVLMSSLSLSPEAPAQRSFVGRSLPDYTFIDSEGYAIHPHHYHGSVLVMFSGIPW